MKIPLARLRASTKITFRCSFAVGSPSHKNPLWVCIVTFHIPKTRQDISDYTHLMKVTHPYCDVDNVLSIQSSCCAPYVLGGRHAHAFG